MSEIKTIAVIGLGQIGSSWAVLFLAKGHRVLVSDPAPQAEQKLKKFIDDEWPTMQQIGLADSADPGNWEFVEDITTRLGEVDFVQENGPERQDFKTKLIGSIDASLKKDAIIASSSSGIPSSQFVSECKIDASRVLIGHPFNPPHIIPLVEVVPHPGTSQNATDRAMAFYRSLGKAPTLVKQEVPGFIANRLQAAVIGEAYSLVSRGIVSAADLDEAMRSGPGLRWAFAGPFLTNVLGGGSGDDPFGHFVDHLGPAVKVWQRDMDEKKFGWGHEEIERLKDEVKATYKADEVEQRRKQLGSGSIELLKRRSNE